MKLLYVCNVRNQYGGGDLPEPLALPRLHADEPPVGAHNAAEWPGPLREPGAAYNATHDAKGRPLPEPLPLPSMDNGG